MGLLADLPPLAYPSALAQAVKVDAKTTTAHDKRVTERIIRPPHNFVGHDRARHDGKHWRKSHCAQASSIHAQKTMLCRRAAKSGWMKSDRRADHPHCVVKSGDTGSKRIRRIIVMLEPAGPTAMQSTSNRHRATHRHTGLPQGRRHRRAFKRLLGRA